MRIERVAKIKGGRQDGAIYNGFLFGFNHRGECVVYEIKNFEKSGAEEEPFSTFLLDRAQTLAPHSNSVIFGSEFYDENDEFPLLYTNVYNNFAKQEDKLKGTCLVYRLKREGREFKTTLVQMIQIGFTEDELWKSAGENEDARPYGNFTIDRDKNLLYAFTMRDNDQITRYFSFDLPSVCKGETCEKYNVKKLVLTKDDVIDFFDCDYHRYIQGATCHKGKIYSLEGFTDDPINAPAIRVIDTSDKKQISYTKLEDCGSKIEPEFIDFDIDTCYYSDHKGNLYKAFFD